MKNMNHGNGGFAQIALQQADGICQQANAGKGSGQQLHGSGDCQLLSSIPDGSISLTADAKASLVYMIEEEKMARDLYDALFSSTGNAVFDRISDSEQKHYDTLETVAAKAGVDISGVSTTAGVFTNPDIQALYDSLLQQGSASLAAAYNVGVLVEQTDISDLQAGLGITNIGVVGTIYTNLMNGSQNHLAAFTNLAAQLA